MKIEARYKYKKDVNYENTHIILLFFHRKELVGSEFVLVQPKSSTGLIRRIRLPQVGLYEHPLVCILVSIHLKIIKILLEVSSRQACFLWIS